MVLWKGTVFVVEALATLEASVEGEQVGACLLACCVVTTADDGVAAMVELHAVGLRQAFQALRARAEQLWQQVVILERQQLRQIVRRIARRIAQRIARRIAVIAFAL